MANSFYGGVLGSSYDLLSIRFQIIEVEKTFSTNLYNLNMKFGLKANLFDYL